MRKLERPLHNQCFGKPLTHLCPAWGDKATGAALSEQMARTASVPVPPVVR